MVKILGMTLAMRTGGLSLAKGGEPSLFTAYIHAVVGNNYFSPFAYRGEL